MITNTITEAANNEHEEIGFRLSTALPTRHTQLGAQSVFPVHSNETI